MFRHAVVGYDGSAEAEAAAAFALWLGSSAASQVTIVHASPTPEDPPSGDVWHIAAEEVANYERAWRRRLDDLVADAPKDAIAELRVVRGSPAGVLLSVAHETGADLVLTGSHGVGRMRGALLGSVSSQVLFHAPCSVMLFRETGWPLETHAGAVVVGLDGSPSSQRALEVAAPMAAALRVKLVLAHAFDTELPFASHPPGAVRDTLRAHGEALIGVARSSLAAPDDGVVEELVEGRTEDQLLDVCERYAPAVLVVGSRGLGGFRELLLGSTSRWVGNCAPCPVLIVRPAPDQTA